MYIDSFISPSGKLFVEFEPEDADDYKEYRKKTVIWSSSRPSLVSIDSNGSYKKTPGNYTTCISPVTITARIEGTSLSATYLIYFDRKNVSYDVDGDGIVNAEDAAIIAEWAKNGTQVDISKYDFNCDGIISSLDAKYPIEYFKTHP